MAISKEVVLDVKYTTSQDKETGVVSLTATVTRNELIPAHIFLFEQLIDETIAFCSIATVTDIQCFPTTMPAKGNPFFRLDTVTLEFDSAKKMKEALDAMRGRINRLVSDYQILVCELESDFTETYRAEC